jgi:glycosyltransferase involved in cell wall biosynthesis
VEIAKSFGAKVFVEPWKGFTEQRNICLCKAQSGWVFFLDADEQASLELGRRLKEIAKNSHEKMPNCFSIKREEYFLGKKLNFGPGNPSHQWRFFKKDAVVFKGDVHEYPVFEGPVGRIEEPIHHFPDLAIDKFLTKMNHYTTLEAMDRFGQGQRTSLFHAFGTFFTTFFKNGIRYGGFLNGKEGFILVLLESISRVMRHLKLWTYWQVYEGKIKINLNSKLPSPGSSQPPNHGELEKPEWKTL